MPEPTCINLAERFGDRYRIGWEAEGATKGQWRREDHPWLMEIRCRYGMVHPYGGEILCGVSDRSRIGAKLRRLPFVLHVRGDIETVIRFHVDHIDAVLAILQPYKRRQVSEAERDRLRAIGAAGQFRKGDGHGSSEAEIDPKTDATAPARTSGRPGGAASILGR